MKKISNPLFISIFTKILVLLVAAKAISLAFLWYLPNEGVELSTKQNYQPKYQRVDFKNMIQRVSKGQKQESTRAISQSGTSITNMILKGLYGTKSKGFIIIALKSNPKNTEIISVGEDYKGYRLKSITKDSAIFEKNSKDYVLYLKMPSAKTTSSITRVNENIQSDSNMDISRDDIAEYAKNPNQIWKDISISEVKEGQEIKGFKVTRINPKSKLASLGLQSGDMIIKANNIRLNSYKDALEIYKNIDTLDVIQMVVIRNNQEMELVYEIN